MRHETWVKNQFGLFKKHKQRGSRYRDILLITSFIETVIRKKASKKCKKRKKIKPIEFKPSLIKLGLIIDPSDERKSSYPQNCQYATDCLIEINLLRVQRNKIIHDIISDSLTEKDINDTIREMKKNIEQVCAKSRLIRNYFNSNYGFDPAKLI